MAVASPLERERLRLRRELHDGIGGALTGLIMTVGAAQARAPSASRDVLAAVERELVELSRELRLLIDDLRPPALAELGLVWALQRHAERLNGLEVTVVEERAAGAPPVPAAVQLAAYRIAAEALTNAARHAGAPRCDVMLLHGPRELRLSVRDYGRGLPSEHTAGVGLAAMRERAEELGGHCEWHSIPERGTLVDCSLPLAGVRR